MPTDTATLTLADLVTALNALPDEQHAEAVRVLQNDGGAVVKAFRSKVFAAGKTEGGKAGGATAEKLTAAEARVEELETQLAEAQAKVPDAAKLEERLTREWTRKVDAATRRAEAAEVALTKERGDGFRTAFGTALRDLDVDPDYADEVLAGRYADRHVVEPDGTRRVRKPGEDTAYDADDVTAAVKLLAADVVKTVPPKFLLSNADSGGGVTNGGAGAGGSGANQWSQLRKEVQQQADARNRPSTTAAERMGLAPIAGGKA